MKRSSVVFMVLIGLLSLASIPVIVALAGTVGEIVYDRRVVGGEIIPINLLSIILPYVVAVILIAAVMIGLKLIQNRDMTVIIPR